jgi:hypothetical protein
MPAVLHTQLSEAINRIALLSASYMQAVTFFFFIASVFTICFFFYMFIIVFFIIIQYVSIAAVPYRVQQHLNLCCATIQGGTAILPYSSVLLRHHTGCNSKNNPFFSNCCGCGTTQGATAKCYHESFFRQQGGKSNY